MVFEFLDITKFKCLFEGNMPVPSKHAITADIYRQVNSNKYINKVIIKTLFYCQVNTRAKKKTRGSKVKVLHEGDTRFVEAKSRAQKLFAKYRATGSPNHIPLSGKYREKACCSIPCVCNPYNCFLILPFIVSKI